MPNWLKRLAGPVESKAAPQSLVTITSLGEANWGRRGFAALSAEGFLKNPIVHRCVRMIAEAAISVPLAAEENGRRLEAHPALALLARPNPRQSGAELFEALFAYLLTAGNAFLEAVPVGGEIRGLYGLRPDRVKVAPGRDGWPAAYHYVAGGATRTLPQAAEPIPRVLHLGLFHPLDDHYGFAPQEACQQSIAIFNAAAAWNKALLDNAARPSGALVYSVANGQLTPEQFARLKDELERGFAGAANAGRPMVLEGGLDWKTIALSPRDMDFVELKNGAAREIALALGVPPMLLGIPGDNTYANFAEANRAFWRQTVVPLVRRVADDLGFWLAPAFGGRLSLVPDLDRIEALAEDRAALWARVGAADFLTDAEKRSLLGVGG